MKSILNEIENLTTTEPVNTIAIYDNRYTILTQNLDRTKTAFCFGVPIYNSHDKSIVNLKFHHNKENSYFTGSNAKITVGESLYFKNDHGVCQAFFNGKIAKKTESAIYILSSNEQLIEVRPTLNGLLFIVPYNKNIASTIRIVLDRPFESIRSNDKYFAVMRENFIPFITVSCIGTINDQKKVVSACEVSYEQTSELEYFLTFHPKNNLGKYLMYEINMQETKLFQDTTVESNQPTVNNAFGGTAFIGQTDYFGEQWLYSRLELTNIPIVYNKKIIHAILHIPKLDGHDSLLSVYSAAERFCSFGSNWENKIPLSHHMTDSSISNEYHHLDITKLLEYIDKKTVNLVIKAKEPESKPCIVSTGDSFFKPPILEVKFR